MKYKEAEATKLLSNTYLDMRVAFFNEVDMLTSKLSMSSAFIKEISSDPRIGNYYNVPSFGFGGYCLPKDVKNLTTSITDDNYPLFKSIIASNRAKMSEVVDNIVTLSDSIREREQKQIITLGVYRLSMNGKNADFRNSHTIDVISHFKDLSEFRVLVFEPCLKTHSSHFFTNCKSLNELKTNSDIILADKYSPELNDVYSKVYTNDISRYNEVSTQTNQKGWGQNQA